jgi:adenylosuccinate lyase
MHEDVYSNPLISRYASAPMSQIFGEVRKFQTWRRLWLVLAESQQELGLPISDLQLDELRNNLDTIDFELARRLEQKLRHDVMAHVQTLAAACPLAAPIIHWGATSCYVTDNTDLIIFKEALHLVRQRIATVVWRLAEFARRHRALSCLSYTHLQPAQPTTVGKRACLWIQDLIEDLQTIEFRLSGLKARGVKGTTGTQASFLQIFNGDHQKVRELDLLVSRKIGFERSYSVTGQTYPRKVDALLLDALAGLGQSAHKFANDVRLLASFKELEEPFEDHQVGSSAMAYKRNPMRCERMCSLARFVISLQSSAANTAAVQWLERTLDDSANRRIVIPQAFLAIDAILVLWANVAQGLVVYPPMIKKRLQDELPFMVTENILMAAVGSGGDRQHLHEKIRHYSQQAGQRVKALGLPNNLIELLQQDSDFAHLDLVNLLNPDAFVGRAPEQVDEFLEEFVLPIQAGFPDSNKSPDELLRV